MRAAAWVIAAVLFVAVPAQVRAQARRARTGSVFVGLVHRNNAPLALRIDSLPLWVTWTGAIGVWERIGAGPLAAHARLEIFGVTEQERAPHDEVLGHVGLDAGVVWDPGAGALDDGLVRGLRLGAALDLLADLAGDSGAGSPQLRPRVSIGWVQPLAIRDAFPGRPLHAELSIAWSPGTLLLELAGAIEVSPM